jgi:integrase
MIVACSVNWHSIAEEHAMGRYQQGYLFRSGSAWHVRYYADGKQKSKRLCDGDLAKKAVSQKFAEFMAEINDPGHTETPDLTVVKFWDDTYLPFIESNLKHSTVYDYKNRWEKHLKPHFGTTLLKDYRTPMGSVYLTKLARTLRPRSVNHIKFLASGIFAHAVATGNCETNPWHDVKVLGKYALQDQETGSYTLEEMENIINTLVDHVECQLIMALAFFAGLRRSEIAALQWGDIDSEFIHVRRGMVRGVVGTPKTKKSVRSVPIIEPVRIPLNEWRRRGCNGWLFKGRDKNEPGDITSLVRNVIEPTLLKSNIEWKGLHAGRRGLGTELKRLTGNSNAGKNVLGHSDEQVTQEHYEGAMPAEALAGMKLLEAKSLSK